MAAAAGAILSVLCAAIIYSREEREARAEFQISAAGMAHEIEQRINYLVHEVEKLGFVMGLGGLRDRQEFEAYVSYVFDVESGIQALEWAPRVTHAQRQGFETAAQRLTPGYRIRDYGVEPGQAAAVREAYFPVLLAAPRAPNAAALGLDLGSESARFDALQRAAARSSVAVSQRLKLVQRGDDRVGLLLVSPVFQGGRAGGQQPEGFAVAVLILEEFLAASLKGENLKHFALTVDDDTDSAQRMPLFSGKSFTSTAVHTGEFLEVPVRVANRLWRLHIAHSHKEFWRHSVSYSWSALGTGIALSLLLVVLGWRAQRRDHQARIIEAHLHAIMEHSPAVIFAKDLEGRYIAVNSAAGQFTLIPPEDIVGKSDDVVYPSLYAKAFRDNDAAALASDTAQYFEEVVTNRDGMQRNLLVVKFPVKDRAGRTGALGGIATDITERKRMESALREQEQMFRTFTDNLPMVFWMTTPDEHKVLFVSAAQEILFQRPREEIYGSARRWLDWVHPDDRVQIRSLSAAGDQIGMFEEEFRILRPDGSYRWVHNRVVPVRNEHDQVYLHVGMMQDVTARRIMEAIRKGIVDAATIANGTAYFQHLVQCLAKVLDVRQVALSELITEAGRRQLRTLAFWQHDALMPNVTCDVAGTPCEQVLNSAAYSCARDAAKKFPADMLLTQLGIESYSGVVLFDRRGDRAGVLAIMDDKPLSDVDSIESILAMVGANASVQLHRERSETELRKSEARFAGIIGSAMDAIITLDAELRIVLFNSAAERIFRCKAEAVLGDTLDRFLPMSARHSHAHLIKAFGATGVTTRAMVSERVLNGVRGTGESFPIQASISQSQVNGEKFYTVILRDLTGQVESERKLLEWSRRYEAAIEASGQLLYDRDLESGAMVFGGDMLRILGYRAEDISGDPRLWFSLILPEDQAAFQAELARSLRELDIFKLAYRVRHRDGWPIYCEDVGRFVRNAAGDAQRLVGFISDVTQRALADHELKAMEEQLRQSQKMEAIGHLSGGIAHDFNNILASVIGYAGLARATPAARQDLKLGQYLRELVKSAERARDLVAQLLAFGRRNPGHPQVIALTPVIGDTVRMLAGSMPATMQIRIEPVAVSVAVEIDPVHLQQVLLNLIINARDAMNARGELVLGAHFEQADGTQRCASCQKEIRGDWVSIWVRDSGPGVDPSVCDRIFEPFFTTKAPGQGSGMGLAVVDGIVHERHGHILVDSSPSGSCFRILLPRAQIGAVATPAPAWSPPHLALTMSRHRIVLVDDEAMITGYVSELLRGEGHQVMVFNDPKQAFSWLEDLSNTADLLLTDRTMAGMTGVELAICVSRIRPSLPVVMLSGYTAEEELRPAAIRRLCKKPIDNAELLRVIEEEIGAKG